MRIYIFFSTLIHITQQNRICSAALATLTHLVTSGMVSVKEDEIPIVSGSSNHQSHLPLEMFDRSKVVAKAFYSQTLSQGVTTQVQTEIEDLIKLNGGDDKGVYPEHTNDYKETTWTRRLFQAVNYHCSELNPQLTMYDANGGGFAKNVLCQGCKCLLALFPYMGLQT